MSNEVETSIGDLQRPADEPSRSTGNGNGNGSYHRDRTRSRRTASSTRVLGTGEPHGERHRGEPRRPPPFDPWRLLDSLTRRWFWLFLAAASASVIGFAAGFLLSDYSVHVPLIRRETHNAFRSAGAEAFQPREWSTQTMLGMLRSPELIRRVSARTQPGIPPDEIAARVQVLPDRNPDFVVVRVTAKRKTPELVALANLYAEEVIRYTQELQANETSEINHYLIQRLAVVEKDLAGVTQQLLRFSREAEVLDLEKETEAYLNQLSAVDLNYETARIDLEAIEIQIRSLQSELARQPATNDRLQSAREHLESLLGRYTELHPTVQAQRLEVERLEKNHTAAPAGVRSAFTGGQGLAGAIYMQILDLQGRKVSLEKRKSSFEALRSQVHSRVKELSGKSIDYALIKGQQKQLEIKRSLYSDRQREAQLLQDNSLGFFRIFAPASLDQVSGRKRWVAMGGLGLAGAVAGAVMAALLILFTEIADTRVKTSADLRRVTGLPVLATLGDLRKMDPAAQIDWAFRTLTLLKGRLNRSLDQSLVCGFISSRHGEGRSTWINLLVSAASQRGLRVLTIATRPCTTPDPAPEGPRNPGLLPAGPTTTLNTNVLAYPAQVSEQFNDPQAQPLVHIPLPGWVWNVERRKQWQAALAHWRQIENLVLLVELPPASEPESVLLAENLPQVIWLSSSGMTNNLETRQHLETLRHARCGIVGAVMNREPNPFWKRHLSGWLCRFTLILLAGCLTTVPFAAENSSATTAAQPATPFSTASAPKRAAWQERLTLGPSDVLDLSLFNHPELTRTNIFVRPDGRISYLQAQDVTAAGLTIDELRARLDEQLGKFYPAARTIISPVAFNSKKYFILGRVTGRGAFPLDRPVTILEAVARARGLETGLSDRNTIELADLSHSFVMRDGKRLSVDLQRLFHQGDFSQNIPLEPGDYLYFPSLELQEIFVLGEVLNPGVTRFAQNFSIVSSIADRGGFTSRSYKKKILVVRGSLDDPETFVVDAGAILSGRMPDFRLQARDIVYVSARPWVRLEELLDAAGEAFVQAAITGWVGEHVRPVITTPLIK